MASTYKLTKLPNEAELRELWHKIGNIRRLSQRLRVNETVLRAEIDRLELRKKPVFAKIPLRIPPTDEAVCESYKRTGSIIKTGAEFGYSRVWVRDRLIRNGIILLNAYKAKTRESMCFTCSKGRASGCNYIDSEMEAAEVALENMGAEYRPFAHTYTTSYAATSYQIINCPQYVQGGLPQITGCS